MRLLVTLALDAPDDADPQGIKERSVRAQKGRGRVNLMRSPW